jgi:hypothetical protein
MPDRPGGSWYQMELGGVHMDDQQRSAIEQARIAWHDHQF